MNKKKILVQLPYLLGSLIMVLATGTWVASAWQSAPPPPAPNCPTDGVSPKDGCFAPLNVSSSSQVKTGALGVGALSVTGESGLHNIKVVRPVGSDPASWYLVQLGSAGPSEKVKWLPIKTSVRLMYYNAWEPPQPGYVLTSLDSVGSVAWKAPSSNLANQACPGGSYIYGFDANGLPLCHAPAVPQLNWLKGEHCGAVSHNLNTNVPCHVNGVDHIINNGIGDSNVSCPAGFVAMRVRSDSGGLGFCVCNSNCGSKN